MVGRKTWGGSDSEELSRALHEIHYAFVKTHFKDTQAQLIEHSFNVFPQIWIERRELASDPIEACTITLADPIVASLQDEHFTCLNHALMMSLGTIGQALYMRLFFHLANLYDGANSQRLIFQKRYDDICTEWLGGLTSSRTNRRSSANSSVITSTSSLRLASLPPTPSKARRRRGGMGSPSRSGRAPCSSPTTTASIAASRTTHSGSLPATAAKPASP